ncbi:hypothetical protein COY16_03185 [Candidatus Roizmanbacteria bacterium CG_4_10_14_0_2_um_filter_39_13]|uniref:Glycosyltransferase RgtA/B/C/D-like domain-containing protein n=1 Tax=Candidatus Roizmanbacteria bacterium CG_4_10_14_0_2_um_filter_39_13 TaxID=1974825 RepID=A0A2M7TYM6_9BACT|nr:MAG: hypothetical protein COY16_03185 [Candidatus Roizmanbacteria bacterium CG_4_10_14_0_2_um_filter_39_13]
MKIIHNFIRTHWQISIYLLFFTIVFSIKIIQNPFPFFDWDESIYAQVGREMIQAKTIVPHWQGQNWLDKPPLVPLFYGLVMGATPFVLPEISTRIATLFLSVFALALTYLLYWKVLKEQWLTTLVVITTSLSSIFLQRAQVLNVDIFLLIGWLGYLLFYKKFWTSLVFLSCAVYSKSLIGFYPVGIMGLFFLYRFLTKQIDAKKLLEEFKRLIIHFLILVIWYIGMFIFYGNNFLYQHFYESHVKRVTASIESHFGQRTFYLDLLFIEFGKHIWWSILGFSLLVYQWIRKRLSDKRLLYALFIIPWFIFLNLTKTKIFWYGHPYIPQFALLMVYPLSLIKKARLIYSLVIISIIITLFHQYFISSNVLDSFYSSNDPHHIVAKIANSYCDELNVVVEPEGREAYQTLKSMDLLITTSRWWGNHPSMIYYFNGDLHFVYTLEELHEKKDIASGRTCFVVHRNDIEAMQFLNMQVRFTKDPLQLYVN